MQLCLTGSLDRGLGQAAWTGSCVTCRGHLLLRATWRPPLHVHLPCYVVLRRGLTLCLSCPPVQADGTLGEVFDVISKSDMVVLLISDAAQVGCFA